MPFTVSEFHDLVALLEERPDWRAELRRLVLPDQLMDLPRLAAEQIEAQRRTDHLLKELARTIAEIVEVQRRTDAHLEDLARTVSGLAEAQRRTEAKVEELAEAQRRTEAKVEGLAEVQRRTEAKVENLAAAQRGTEVAVGLLQKEVGVLSNRIGATLEEEAADVVRLLVEQKGLRVQGAERTIVVNGDVDVFLQAEDANGRLVSVLVESKARLSARAVEAWSSRARDGAFRARLAAAGAPAPYLIYAYGMRVDIAAERAARGAGIGVATSRGELVAPVGEVA